MITCRCATFPQISLDGGHTFTSLREASRLPKSQDPDALSRALMKESDGTIRPITSSEIDEVRAIAAEEDSQTE